MPTDELEIVLKPELIKKFHDFFAETTYGKILAANIRFGRYKPESFTNKEWEKLLGPDINNLDHALVIYDCANDFVRECNNGCDYKRSDPATFSEQEKCLLLLAAIIHDWGEAVVGDVIRDLKTEEHNAREMAALKEIAADVTAKYINGICRRMIGTVIDNIVANTATKLGAAFEMIEELANLQTALRAWTVSRRKKEIADNLQWITANVLVYLPMIMAKGGNYPTLRNYLIRNKSTISHFFSALPRSVFNHYPPEEKKKKIAMFAAAKKEWRAYLETL